MLRGIRLTNHAVDLPGDGCLQQGGLCIVS